MPMNPRKLVPTQEPGILDFAPGAAAAYSLRSLSNSYASPVVTVRRSTDNAEADFTATEVNDGTLAGWAGADGFVKQWWDQSGNARHATQATAGYQPQIVDSGVLVTEGGKAAVQFDGVDDRLTTAAFSSPLTAQSTAAAVCRINPFSTDLFFVYDGLTVPNRRILGHHITYGWYVYMGLDVGPAVAGDDKRHILFGVYDTQSKLYLDGYLARTAAVGSNALDGLTIGSRYDGADHFWIGTISELIIYPTDQTALRTRIEGNLAWYY